jgi:hypothetical protein
LQRDEPRVIEEPDDEPEAEPKKGAKKAAGAFLERMAESKDNSKEKKKKNLDGPNCPTFFQVFAQIQNHNIYSSWEPFFELDVAFATSILFFPSLLCYLNDDAFATSF